MEKRNYGCFVCQEDETGRLLSLQHKDDSYHMNWVEGMKPWGTVICPEGIEVHILRQETEDGGLKENYLFVNKSNFPISFCKTDVGIYTTFNDNYEDTDICLAQKCHAHIFCGREASWVMVLQMSGRGPHLGLKVLKGSILSYSVERRLEEESNDRGDFILHPELPILQPGGCAEVIWELFWHDGKADFMKKLLDTPDFPIIKAEQFTYYIGETICFSIESGEEQEIRVTCEGKELKGDKQKSGNGYSYCYTAKEVGEICFKMEVGSRKSQIVFFVTLPLLELVERRCSFIAEKQQYHMENSCLDGAYLIYDNEEEKHHYSHLDDHNGGRERICMGILQTRFLQLQDSTKLRESLNQYVAYVYRELYDEKTGIVYNDVTRNNDWNRLYNYPWMSVFQMELYRLTKEKKYLTDSCRTLHRYYLEGGTTFYGIAIPAVELLGLLWAEEMDEEAEQFKNEFVAHAEQILKNGLHYPPFEVRYEQSIVAPAVSCLLQAYVITKKDEFLKEGERQLAVLELFNGCQPDYHLYETAIRHWDGRWFGKHRRYGDTFPHYWSALTGIAYKQYYCITGAQNYLKKAHASFRGCLNLFTIEGRGSCAMLYPTTINGEPGNYYDPWANDQDWALYFALRYIDIVGA